MHKKEPKKLKIPKKNFKNIYKIVFLLLYLTTKL